MIGTQPVTDALLVYLTAVGAAIVPPVPVGDHDNPPDPSSGRYGVLELVPGGSRAGSMGAPEGDAWLVYRLRGVGFDPSGAKSPGVGRREAQGVAQLFGAALLDRSQVIQGTGWRVGGRDHVADGGVVNEGPVSNKIDDYRLFVTTR